MMEKAPLKLHATIINQSDMQAKKPMEYAKQDWNYPYCRNSVLSILLFCLVLFNAAFLLRGLLFIPQRMAAAKMCEDGALQMKLIDQERVIDVAFFAKYAYKNMKIVRGMDRTVFSILQNTATPIRLHILLDLASKKRVSRTLHKLGRQHNRKINVTYYDVEEIAEDIRDVIDTMKKFFFIKDVGRYSDDIFFMSEVFHLIFPKSLQQLIFLDTDLKFLADIQELYDQFSKFESSNIIGIAPDLQPQYRIDFAQFRVQNPKTSVGSNRPGKQGFNTGVTLFHLQRMRESALYNFMLNSTTIERLCLKYQFKGYLGHQDFFTLVGMEYPELFYNLDCSWNRQLDTGWQNNVETAVFDLYHSCKGKVKVYHGNGNANIPEYEDEEI